MVPGGLSIRHWTAIQKVLGLIRHICMWIFLLTDYIFGRNLRSFLKGSDNGVLYLEKLGFWTLSIV